MSYLKKGMNEPLTEKELMEIIETFGDSEDELENISSDDDTEVDCGDPVENITEVDIIPHTSDVSISACPDMSTKSKKITYRNILWSKKILSINENVLEFKGSSKLPNSILDLDTPYNFFQYFLDDKFLQKVCDQTNLYSSQKNPNNNQNFNVTDIKKFIGILQYMSIVKLPNSRCYWRPDIGVQDIFTAMSINKFEKLKNTLHFSDNSQMLNRDNLKYDKLFKIRPLVDELNMKFSQIPLEDCLSLDEQICANKVRHHLKQYLPMKPNKWEFKLFVLCDTKGLAYNFEIYTGAEDFYTQRKDDEPDLGASGNVVVRLTRIINKFMNYTLYCDNYYISIPLLVFMAKNGIYVTGTARRNRIPNCKLMDEYKMKKMPRGTSEEFLACVDGVDISNVGWIDNKVVTFLSNKTGEMPKGNVKRFDKKTKQNITIDRPNVTKVYNTHMGGVDLLDSHIGRNHVSLRSKNGISEYFAICWTLLLSMHGCYINVHQKKKGKKITSAYGNLRLRLQNACVASA